MLSDLSSRDKLLGHLAYQKSMMGGMNNMVTGQQGQNKQNHKHITQTSHEDDQNSSRHVGKDMRQTKEYDHYTGMHINLEPRIGLLVGIDQGVYRSGMS